MGAGQKQEAQRLINNPGAEGRSSVVATGNAILELTRYRI